MPLDQQHEHERGNGDRAEMSFFDHLSELRSRILRSVIAITVVGTACFLNKQFIFGTVIFGPRNADFPTYSFLCNMSHKLGLGESMCFAPPTFKIITRDLGEVIMQHLYVSFWLGILGAFPYIFYQFWQFVKPGLLEKEQSAVRGVVAICSFLFILGNLFGYYVIAPFSISFLGNYTIEGMEVTPTLDSYVTYITMFTIPTGLIFEMPVVAYFVAKVGLIGASFLRKYRRHALVIILIIAAIITPPDVVSQTLVTIPLYGLYEISIMVVARVQRKRELAMKEAERANRGVVTRNEED